MTIVLFYLAWIAWCLIGISVSMKIADLDSKASSTKLRGVIFMTWPYHLAGMTINRLR